MCLAAIAYEVSPAYPVVIAANRDERHARPSASAHWWRGEYGILGGRDLVAGGGWLAVGRDGRLAAVTNVRETPPQGAAGVPSRGLLVRDYLAGSQSAAGFAAELDPVRERFAPFNLLLLDAHEFRYCSNRAPSQRLGAGLHVLSNAPLGTVWPKTDRARQEMAQALEAADPLPALLELLGPPDDRPAETQDYRSSIFITGSNYGTRASTVVLLAAGGELTFAERRFDAGGAVVGESMHRFLPCR